jgi:endonuclease YncB( thermonuclease family)
MTRRFLWIGALLAIGGAVTVTAAASRHVTPKTTARVVGVPTGDTLLVRVGKQKPARVHILGVRAPAGSSCYAGESKAATRGLAMGQRVTLIGDLVRGAYVVLPNGSDLARTLLGRGAAQVDVWGPQFSRLAAYVPVQESSESSATGMWGACAADLSVSVSGPARVLPGEYATYTVTAKNAGPLATQRVNLELRPGSYAKQLVSVASPNGTCTSQSWMASCSFNGMAAGAVISATVVLRALAPGALAARAVISLVGCASPQCGGAPLLDSNLLNDEAAASTIVPGGVYGQPGRECDPGYAGVCIPPPPPDLDCADFAPLRKFAVRRDVADPDPHHLDGNNDGIACEGDDY